MIVWINGPFGVGKTTLTAELCRRQPRARAFDPERIGWVLKRTVGLVRQGDYQDLPAWRSATVAVAARQTRGADPLVVPMTVLRREHLDEIFAGLRSRGHEVRHVLLDVSAPALVERIESDPDPDPQGWRLDNLGTYLVARHDLRRGGAVVDTDDLTADEVADEVEALIRHWRDGRDGRDRGPRVPP
ncbi:AAA family ATPase [Dactylosporangium roseum]|uniref:AAA family ATPase n=1 Tax=Dactylosporangium roseum TaxID=47989 RepID=A0ABY5ZCF4_9ACTN|nr:AAA family ATPase [Dactylosporangium roseum]UWZ38670.1 AAA family ATPase [Dactylosporangium roseum]